MALKEQVSNVYGVGLRNVGSYQVSGVPHVTTATIADGAETSIKFPQVTKDITFNKTTTGGEVRVHFLTKGTQKKALEFRNVTPSDGLIDDYFSIPINKAAEATYTFSFWFNQAVVGSGNQFSLWKSFTGGSPVMNAKIQSLSPSSTTATIKTHLKDEVNGNATTNHVVYNVPYIQTELTHYVVSISATSGQIYINGSDIGATVSSLPNGIQGLTTLQFPHQTSAGGLLLSQFTLWNKALSSAEVVELYNSGRYRDPRQHSANSNLSSWFAFDNTLSSNPDTVTQVFDRVGSMTGSVLLGSGQTTSARYVDGFGNFQTGSTVIAGGHYISLTDARPSITLNCKCNKIFLASTGSSQTVSVTANMTHIPSGNMFALTGSGIDE